jgi:hypothetical protein
MGSLHAIPSEEVMPEFAKNAIRGIASANGTDFIRGCKFMLRMFKDEQMFLIHTGSGGWILIASSKNIATTDYWVIKGERSSVDFDALSVAPLVSDEAGFQDYVARNYHG